MQIVNKIEDLRLATKSWRLAGSTIAFVPTMGNLHEGHLKLVEAAKAEADKVVVSIFVNPTQFGQEEDFEAYPRTEDDDGKKLEAAGIDALFLPDVSEIYTPDANTVVSVKQLSTLHCGHFRPGHFDGVATVVCKLFNMVQPDIAFFGQKDFQQLAIIRTMTRDLNIPVLIKSIATVREASGLAMSSRNAYLTQDELKVASQLYQSLCDARNKVILGERCYPKIENEALDYLQHEGFVVDYFSICNQESLLRATEQDTNLIVLTAAKLGRTRLIDNVCLTISKQSFCDN